jgi:putative CRISPR-associated protein (TIGR02619 family)
VVHRVVITSGTSLFLRPNLGAVWLEGRGAKFVEARDRQIQPRGEPASVFDAAELSWTELPEVTDPKRVSAEYSALSALARSGQLGTEPAVVLIHTATFDGELAARLVGLQLERDFEATVRLVPIAGMDVADRQKLRGSLGGFMHQVAKALREGDRGSTVFAPLGGFKVMTSLGYLTGAYCGYSSIYLHEIGQALHTMPWVPVEIDAVALREVAPLARRARRMLRWEALSGREQQQVEEHGWLFERDGADVALGPFGEFLAREERYRELFRTRVMVAEGELDTLREHRGEVQRDVRHLLDWLPYEHTERRGEMHHEVAFGHHGARYALYKHGGSVLRMAWRYDEGEDVLFLRRVWVEHDRYEREAARGEVLGAEPAGWVDETELVEVG